MKLLQNYLETKGALEVFKAPSSNKSSSDDVTFLESREISNLPYWFHLGTIPGSLRRKALSRLSLYILLVQKQFVQVCLQ